MKHTSPAMWLWKLLMWLMSLFHDPSFVNGLSRLMNNWSLYRLTNVITASCKISSESINWFWVDQIKTGQKWDHDKQPEPGPVRGNAINYMSLSCQMFSTIISYNKSFNSAANQIEWSTFRKCCHCILVGSTNCRQRIISHINFPWATNASLVPGEIMKIWNIDEGEVLRLDTWSPHVAFSRKKLFLAPDSAL